MIEETLVFCWISESAWTGPMTFCPDGVSHTPSDPKITPDCVHVIQTNNVELDDRGLIYSADRAGTGLHIMRLTGHAKDVVSGK